MTFNKLLIANRGEIATRIIRTAHALGFETVAVYSEADADALHVQLADQAVCIGAPEVGASYLNIERILAAASQTGADAIHPGYGFLSENAQFAQAVIDAGLTWIGPAPQAISAMGNKSIAKDMVQMRGVPLVPGYGGVDQSVERFVAAANEIGYPVMVKAVAGGGGRGMRLVECETDMLAAVMSAKSEAMTAFGAGELMLEKAIVNPRHIEIQIFGDQHGNVVHLGERDCSIQRRHQKVIEESPSPAIDAALRENMGNAAIIAAKAVDYVGAGTVEFLLDEAGDFYFIEMNTRLQVEHPVTELVTGLDLVEWQLLVAAGEPLPLTQDDIELKGHAIEVRLYAESPANGFLPSIGRIHHWQPPAGIGVRVDHGLQSGQEITPFYDAMVAKIITSGHSREMARRRMRRALQQTVVLGVECNRGFLLDTIDHPIFRHGEATTAFIEATDLAAVSSANNTITLEPLAALIMYQCASRRASSPLRNWMSRETTYCFDAVARQRLVKVVTEEDGVFLVNSAEFRILNFTDNQIRYAHNGVQQTAYFAFSADGELWVQAGRQTGMFVDYLLTVVESADSATSGNITAPMPGSVLRLMVAAGDHVTKGQPLLILEAMKMEHTIAAPFDGTVEQIFVIEKQQMKPKELMRTVANGSKGNE